MSIEDEDELHEHVAALRAETEPAVDPAATRARLLASLAADSDGEDDLEGEDDDGAEPWDEAVAILRAETAAVRGPAETRERVLADPRRRPAVPRWITAAAAALVLFVGVPEALAATGYFPAVTRAVSAAERYVARALGWVDDERPQPQAARPAAPLLEPAEAREVEAAPVEAAPVEAAPVEAAPIEAAPVEAAPIEAAPVERDVAPRSVEASAPPRPRRQARPAPRAPVEPTEPGYDPAEHDRFQAADRLHTSGAPSAVAAWDAYLSAYPGGRYALEARYNRAIALIRAGRLEEARAALEPFERGVHGGYRQREARALGERLRGDAPGEEQDRR